MKNDSVHSAKMYLSSINPLILHLIFATIAYVILYLFGALKQLPCSANIVNWDAGIYHVIKNVGYSFDSENSIGNTGLYPLFPMVWRGLSLPPIGMAIVNLSMFLICLQWLVKTFNVNRDLVLLYISIPSIIFFFLPFSESLFFVFSTLFLIGWEKKNYLLVIVGCVLAGITRPSIFYFFPAIIFVAVYFWKTGQLNAINRKFLLLIFLASSFGVLLSLALYYKLTGDPLAFFHMRKQGNGLTIPGFPLTTWRGAKLLWLDGFAFMICFGVVLTFLPLLYKGLIAKKDKVVPKDFTILFTIGYIVTTTIHILFFNLKDPAGSTSLLGLNRFVFATPFFLILLIHYGRPLSNSLKSNYIALAVLLVGLGLLGVYHPKNLPEHLRPAIYITFMTLFWVFQHKAKYLWIGVYILQTILQVILLDKFLEGLWVG